MDKFLDLAKARYSVRKYKDTPIEDDKLDKIIEVDRVDRICPFGLAVIDVTVRAIQDAAVVQVVDVVISRIDRLCGQSALRFDLIPEQCLQGIGIPRVYHACHTSLCRDVVCRRDLLLRDLDMQLFIVRLNSGSFGGGAAVGTACGGIRRRSIARIAACLEQNANSGKHCKNVFVFHVSSSFL